ncbi:hypothetical protein VMCG_08190 [Cytospora schulzeri]|uniref:Uncharacterized protein n=1 Tax=Cytospora schulzeri TaxID=448051 RepID=A0A423VU62_9PEZI|nr:hypothetical protein VMCG_08190 [Valsa malicola]
MCETQWILVVCPECRAPFRDPDTGEQIRMRRQVVCDEAKSRPGRYYGNCFWGGDYEYNPTDLNFLGPLCPRCGGLDLEAWTRGDSEPGPSGKDGKGGKGGKGGKSGQSGQSQSQSQGQGQTT